VTDPVAVTLTVTAALDACHVPYTVGGSLASSFSGEPRASIDADILVAMTGEQIQPLLEALGPEFYADEASLARAVATHGSTNLIHRPSGIKVDLFVAGSALDQLQLERRRRIQVATRPDRFLYIHSPEDILLQTLHWYRPGGEVSDRQWRDVLAIIVVQGGRLDREYLAKTAANAGLSDLLKRTSREVETSAGPDS
jgi:hypothetical protein